MAHDCAVDWLELNMKGTHLLFRDRAARLHLYNVATGERKQLLQFVGYVQWVPDSDVIVVRSLQVSSACVYLSAPTDTLFAAPCSSAALSLSYVPIGMQAQSRRNLCVWYSIHKTDQPFIFEIEGQVQDIERNAAATEVLVQEDPNGGEEGIVGYQLDDTLVRSSSLACDTPLEWTCNTASYDRCDFTDLDVPEERTNTPHRTAACAQVYFAAAMESDEYEAAAAVLEPLDRSADTEPQWRQLAAACIAALPSAAPLRALALLQITERCYAAVGNVARAAYVRLISEEMSAAAVGDDAALVRAQVSYLHQLLLSTHILPYHVAQTRFQFLT